MAHHSIVIPTRDKLFNISEFLTPTPGNIISAIILAVGLVITVIRFTVGIGSVTNLSDVQPWGMWIGFDLLCGVCLAAGGYFTTVACYIMGMKHFHSAVRPAITTAFLGYAFVVIALLYDLGHPLRLPFMFFFPGTTSVLFEVGLCVATYVSVLLIEFSVAPLEWMSCRYPWLIKVRKIVVKCTIPLTIFGVTLSTLHQSSLGSLYLISPGKVFPLWYSPFMPMFFFVSSMAAGASMVIFEGMLALRAEDFNTARSAFAAAVPLQPDADSQALASFYLGYADTLECRWQEALPALAAAARLCPDMKEYGNLLGVAHFKTGDYAKAAEAFRAVLRVDKGSAMDLANLGLCEKFMGNAEQAREYLSAALELDASLDFARNHLAELEGQAN